VDGIVCGHIHKAEIREIGGLLYCNDGDWVGSCTALAETLEGRLEIVHWGYLLGEMRDLKQPRTRGAGAPTTVD
jgi:predicted phosphodiesterase